MFQVFVTVLCANLHLIARRLDVALLELSVALCSGMLNRTTISRTSVALIQSYLIEASSVCCRTSCSLFQQSSFTPPIMSSDDNGGFG